MEKFTLDSKKSFVVISKAKEIDYTNDYVALPKNYGSKTYYAREDIQAIQEMVCNNLTTLDNKIHFTNEISNKKVIIKPNLVGVFNNIGFTPKVSAQSTDPRVIDSVIEFLKKYTDEIIIAEASGSGFPTRSSFKLSGISKIAKRYNIEVMPLEEQPVDRYYLPKAQAMNELLIPRIFSEVVNGEAFYISFPKMKTNLYTDITLGLKNGMGIIPLNLRQRNHNYNLEKKLVDLLFLINPHLTIIDGIVGSGGQCPASTIPIESNFLVSGNNVVETDLIAAKLMGFDPATISLLQHAKQMGFGNNQREVIGDQTPAPFVPANPSLVNKKFQERFPKIQALIGFDMENTPKISDINAVNQETMEEMELVCRGGCLACTKLGLEILIAEGVGDYEVTIIIGNGVKVNGKGSYYFDRTGKAYTKEDIAKIETPTLATGDCTIELEDIVDYYAPGCLYYPGLVHTMLHKISDTKCVMMTRKNKFLLSFAWDTLRMRIARRRQIRKGNYVDIKQTDIDQPKELDNLTEEQQKQDYIKWPMPPMTRKVKRQLLKEEWNSVMILFK